MNYDKAYNTGFEARCRELGVSPDTVVKQAQYAGGLGGAAIGGVIGAMRGPKGRRYKQRERLYNMLKGLMVGGVGGAIGELGLRKHVTGKAEALNAYRDTSVETNNRLRVENPSDPTLGARAKFVNQKQRAHTNSPLTALSELLTRGSDKITGVPGAIKALPGQLKQAPGILRTIPGRVGALKDTVKSAPEAAQALADRMKDETAARQTAARTASQQKLEAEFQASQRPKA